jgi:DDE superfamily endonuclease
MPALMGCSTCWPGRCGTTTGSAMTSVTTWSSTSATLGPVLVVDDTGDLKRGTGTVGVQRQYTGTAGPIENARVAVYLVYASGAGHAVVDVAGSPWPCSPTPSSWWWP